MSVRNVVKAIQDIMRKDAGVDGDAQRISQLCWMLFLKIVDDQDQERELFDEGYRSPIPKGWRWRDWAADPEGITGEALLDFVNEDLFPTLKELRDRRRAGDMRARVVRGVFEDAYNYMKSGQLLRQVINKLGEIDFNELARPPAFRRHLRADPERPAERRQCGRVLHAARRHRIHGRPDRSEAGRDTARPGLRHRRFPDLRDAPHARALRARRRGRGDRCRRALRAVEKKQLPHMLCVTNMLLHGIEDPSFVRHDNTLARPYVSYTARKTESTSS